MTVSSRPPSVRRRAVIVAPCALAIARTIERPRPWWPWSVPVRAGPKHQRDLILTDQLTAVGDDHGRLTVDRGRADLEVTAGHVVTDRVVDQVRDQALDQRRIAFGRCRVEFGGHAQVVGLEFRARGFQFGSGDDRQVQRSRCSSPRSLLASVSKRLEQALLLISGGPAVPGRSRAACRRWPPDPPARPAAASAPGSAGS